MNISILVSVLCVNIPHTPHSGWCGHSRLTSGWLSVS